MGSDENFACIYTDFYIFNSRSPYGERLTYGCPLVTLAYFQFTLPVWGATDKDVNPDGTRNFQFTLPVWGATRKPHSIYCSSNFSIHAPRMGSDEEERRRALERAIFNSRSPYGERHDAVKKEKESLDFQFTLPVWGATSRIHWIRDSTSFSIHAPRMGSDLYRD